MHNPFDQLVKRISARALRGIAVVAVEHEVSPDARTIDVWAQPDPAREPERINRGLLGRMTARAAMIEAYHSTPGIDDVRGCIHKQIGLDFVRLAEARRKRRPRPEFPYLWILSSGRPMSVIQGYAFSAIPDYPRGFLGREEADALGIVVLRDLPRTRETLILRLMGAADVLRDAIVDLMELPEDAWEREVAMEELIALRFEIPHDPEAESQRDYLMSTNNLYEHWKRHYQSEGAKQGHERGVKEALCTLYRSRFGELPAPIAAVIEATHDTATLNRWVALFGTASRADVVCALGRGLLA